MADLPALPTDEQAEKLKQGGFLPQGFSFNPLGGVIASPSDSTIGLNPMGGVIIGNNPPVADTASVAPTAFTPMNNGQPLPSPAPAPIGAGGLVGDLSSQVPDGGMGAAGIGMPQLPSTAGYDLQQAALLNAAKVGNAKGAAEAAETNRIMQENQKRIDLNAANELDRQNKLDTTKGELDKSIADLATQKVDPNRYWANKSTGDKVLAGIGMFLGAFGQGGNKAASIIQNAIQTDIDAQKADIDTKKDAVSAKRGVYSDMLGRFKDKRMAEEATRIAYLDNAQMKLKSIDAQYAWPETKAKSAMLYGQIEQQKIDAQTNFLAQAAKNHAMQGQIQDPIVGKILQLPRPELQKQALEELGETQSWNGISDDLVNEYNKIKSMGLSAKVPSGLGGNSEVYEAALGKISAALVSKSKGLRTDSDFRNILRPMLPNATETPDAAEKKFENFKSFLKSNATPTPLLNGMGLTPKPLSERLNVQKGLAK